MPGYQTSLPPKAGKEGEGLPGGCVPLRIRDGKRGRRSSSTAEKREGSGASAVTRSGLGSSAHPPSLTRATPFRGTNGQGQLGPIPPARPICGPWKQQLQTVGGGGKRIQLPCPPTAVRKAHCFKWGPASTPLFGGHIKVLVNSSTHRCDREALCSAPPKVNNSCQAIDLKRHLSGGRPAGHYPTKMGWWDLGALPLSTALQAIMLGSSTFRGPGWHPLQEAANSVPSFRRHNPVAECSPQKPPKHAKAIST